VYEFLFFYGKSGLDTKHRRKTCVDWRATCRKMTEAQFGNYTCVATNLYGRGEATLTVTGTVPARIHVLNLNSSSVPRKDKLILKILMLLSLYANIFCTQVSLIHPRLMERRLVSGLPATPSPGPPSATHLYSSTGSSTGNIRSVFQKQC
jgi:hypothetical protein